MTDDRLIEGLMRPEAYPHAVETPIKLHETHISWVLMTGEHAYKIKKPVKLPFLDFSTPDLRQRYCDEEVHLNRRTAPELYVGVVPITGTREKPAVDGSGDAIDHAVKMRQFADRDRLDKVLEAGELDFAALASFGERLAAFHESADAAESASRGRSSAVTRRMRENLAELEPLCTQAEARALARISDWTKDRLGDVADLIDRRAADGRVREGHGDMHLRNLVRIGDGIQAFDCIEFDSALRWIDVIDDLAFTLMDLELNGASDAAAVLLDAYLRASGDYEGLGVLDLYIVYRAMVRAKVAALERQDADGERAERASRRIAALLDLASARSTPRRPPCIVLMHGLPASGKSRVAAQLVAALPAIRVSSDVERKRLAGLGRTERSDSPVGGGLYSAEQTKATYERLARLARTIVAAGFHAIVDATFLKRGDRETFYDVASSCGSPVRIVDCTAPPEELERRVAERARGPADSEADRDVLEHARQSRERVGDSERAAVIEVDTSRPYDAKSVARDVLT